MKLSEQWRSREERKKKRRHLIVLPTRVTFWKEGKTLLLPGNPLPLWASGRGPDCGNDFFVFMCAFLALKMASGSWDPPMCETRIFIPICATLEIFISELLSFSGTQSSSLYVMDIIQSICRQHIWTHYTCKLSQFLGSSLLLPRQLPDLAGQLTPSQTILFIAAQNQGLAPLFLRITEYKSWEKPGGGGVSQLSLDNSSPFLKVKLSIWPQLL